MKKGTSTSFYSAEISGAMHYLQNHIEGYFHDNCVNNIAGNLPENFLNQLYYKSYTELPELDVQELNIDDLFPKSQESLVKDAKIIS